MPSVPSEKIIMYRNIVSLWKPSGAEDHVRYNLKGLKPQDHIKVSGLEG